MNNSKSSEIAPRINWYNLSLIPYPQTLLSETKNNFDLPSFSPFLLLIYQKCFNHAIYTVFNYCSQQNFIIIWNIAPPEANTKQNRNPLKSNGHRRWVCMECVFEIRTLYDYQTKYLDGIKMCRTDSEKNEENYHYITCRRRCRDICDEN